MSDPVSQINNNSNSNSQSLDSLSLIILDSLHQGDENRLEKILSQIPSFEQQVLSSLVNCWRSDITQNNSFFNDLLKLCHETELVFPHLIAADKILEIEDLSTHNDLIFRSFRLISKSSIQLDKKLLNFYEIIKTKGFIVGNNLIKAFSNLESINYENDRFIEGYRYYLLGVIYKLRGSRNYLKARQSLEKAIDIFELYQPNKYLLNLAKFQLALFNETSPTTLSQIANEFTNVGCARDANLAIAQYNYLTKFNKDGLIVHNSRFDCEYERVGNYYFISQIMQDCLKRLSVIAGSRSANILILGQEGTGKEVFARTIHHLSDRAHKPFLAINCSQLPNDLFEAEMFGYEKGAYTGAVTTKRGLLEECEGGIMFLDEIAELTKEAQSKLLTVLQSGTFRRMGTTREIKVDVRFIGATNREVSKMVEREKVNRRSKDPVITGTFRSDLLNRFPLRIVVPTLKQRPDEIIYLSEIFLNELAQGEQFILSEKAKNYLVNREYPSNVRSLRDFINCAIACAKDKKVAVISDKILLDAEVYVNIDTSQSSDDISVEDLTFDEQLRNFAKNLLINTMIDSNHNVKLAATRLGIAERTFYDYLKRYGIKH